MRTSTTPDPSLRINQDLPTSSCHSLSETLTSRDPDSKGVSDFLRSGFRFMAPGANPGAVTALQPDAYATPESNRSA